MASRGGVSVRIWRLALILGATFAASALVFLPTAALTFEASQSALAVRLWPFDAAAKGRLAAGLLQTPLDLPTIAEADALSSAALRRDPMDVDAARVQGVIAAARKQDGRSLGWLRYAEDLSRRDFATQTILIELAVRRGDVSGALVHYDRALRTNAGAEDVLFPVLFAATADPNITAPLARLLSGRPEWWWDFTIKWEGTTPSAAPLFTILSAERLVAAEPRDRAVLLAGLRQLVSAGRIDLAARLYDQMSTSSALPAGTFADGSFNGDRLPPFGWDVTDQPGLAGIIGRRSASARGALTIMAADDQSGTVAQQLLRLRPGRYRIAFRSGDVVDGGIVPTIAVACIGDGVSLADQRLQPGATAIRRFDFTVPANCVAQTLKIGGIAGTNDDAERPWIEDMSLHPLP